jgi:hypothetical protein
MKMKKGGMASRKLKDMAAALSARLSRAVSFRKKTMTGGSDRNPAIPGFYSS